MPAAGEVQIRFASLDLEAGELARLRRFLSTDELARADRLINQQHRDRFVAGRGFLRETLADYLGLEPEMLRFNEGEHGKPSLAEETGGSCSRRFNLSHKGGRAVLAVSGSCEVGIDLEQMLDNLPFREMAQRFFAPRETEELFSLPPHLQLSAFYRFWTRKEAYLKGLGTGFSRPADSFAVSLLPDQPLSVVDYQATADTPSRWTIADIPVPEGFCAALATEGAAPVITTSPWN
ncbi:4'-phosphopantetheinyl transferase [Geotalea uraniireducens Rf4]|uniref:4'-phosphopantetheinyl transferase n=2 Tax=Geotalea uraniireducens TaxID=351604 RepID=A5GFJ1_GEOUR|nr:4'-phosphopantetheinyl transferase [Geotalea uraniireducens Rf4]